MDTNISRIEKPVMRYLEPVWTCAGSGHMGIGLSMDKAYWSWCRRRNPEYSAKCLVECDVPCHRYMDEALNREALKTELGVTKANAIQRIYASPFPVPAQ